MRKVIHRTFALFALTVLLNTGPAVAQVRDWPWLGVIITDISSGNVEGYIGGGGGAYVTGVEQPGPAFAAGLSRHDIIVGVDGRSTLNTRELTCLIQVKRPGDTILVTVMRGGRQQSVPATLGRWPENKEFPRPAVGNCGGDPVSSLRGPQLAAVVLPPVQRVTANAASAGTPNTTTRNGSSPMTE
jgi:serine protease Do